MTVSDLVDETFLAYNGARLREACSLFARRILRPDVTVGLSLTGALTPAGLGMSCLIPLIENGMIDWIVSTGANLYHDAHFGLGHSTDVDLVEIRWPSGLIEHFKGINADQFLRVIEGKGLSRIPY